MSFFATGMIIGGGSLLGGIIGGSMQSSAANNAAQLQAQAAANAQALQQQEFNQIQNNQAPWLAAGRGALAQMQDPSFQHTFNAQDFYNNMDPAYQFDLQQGQQAIERSAAARGGLQSTGTLKDVANYAQGMASNEYQNAYNRFQNDQSQRFNRLSSLAGLGQTANGQVGEAGMNMANQNGGYMTGAANAAGAAGIASANAWSGALNNGIGAIGNNWMQSQMLNRMYGQQPGIPPMGGGMGMAGWGVQDQALMMAPEGALDLGAFGA